MTNPNIICRHNVVPGLKIAEKEMTNLIDKHLGLGPSAPPPSAPAAAAGPHVINIPIQMPDSKPPSGPKITQIPIQRPDKPSRPEGSNISGFGRTSGRKQGWCILQ